MMGCLSYSSRLGDAAILLTSVRRRATDAGQLHLGSRPTALWRGPVRLGDVPRLRVLSRAASLRVARDRTLFMIVSSVWNAGSSDPKRREPGRREGSADALVFGRAKPGVEPWQPEFVTWRDRSADGSLDASMIRCVRESSQGENVPTAGSAEVWSPKRSVHWVGTSHDAWLHSAAEGPLSRRPVVGWSMPAVPSSSRERRLLIESVRPLSLLLKRGSGRISKRIRSGRHSLWIG